ncbi:uncharacterized protein DUF1223 [Kordia periserrulae]|uniref:Uncharacterized protein DUF1223 n=1 Tax=Kordia periserrulae TaxID=701523 RepID=A0A2T6C385_9FLAO|nr:DUF1223 domain-containing protein [Kordia periserrulae]PTX62779.1 uncharacterized protein DUF1223 [Kordia periserrulae]
MKRKYLITLSLFAMLIVTSFTTIVEPKHDGVVVLELFTSQGCSSCPSADDLLGKVSDEFENKNVFALSYHVDYWNYIGWNDPFSQKEFTQKQRSYAQKFRDNQIYTPAVVVNGKEHFVGSNRAKMYAKIKSYQQKSSTYNISLDAMENTSETIKFNYTIDGNITATNARVVLVIKERTTHVKRGENANRTLKNHNIVVAETYLTTFENKGNYAVNIPKIVNKNDELRLFFILENDSKDIVGASSLDF